jgi:hypothetical protein
MESDKLHEQWRDISTGHIDQRSRGHNRKARPSSASTVLSKLEVKSASKLEVVYSHIELKSSHVVSSGGGVQFILNASDREQEQESKSFY